MNLLSGLGLTDTAIFYAKDEADSIADRLEVLAQSFDFIITVGGTGQGKSDMLRLALKRAGAKQSEDQTKLSSSLPFVCANLKGAVLFGLPGNPLGFVNIVQRVVLPVLAVFQNGSFLCETVKKYSWDLITKAKPATFACSWRRRGQSHCTSRNRRKRRSSAFEMQRRRFRIPRAEGLKPEKPWKRSCFLTAY